MLKHLFFNSLYTGVGLTHIHKTLHSKINVWFLLFDFCNGVKKEGPA